MPVIITENTDTSGVVEQLAADLNGVSVLRLAAGSLSLPEGPAPDYLDYMTVNVQALVSAYEAPDAGSTSGG